MEEFESQPGSVWRFGQESRLRGGGLEGKLPEIAGQLLGILALWDMVDSVSSVNCLRLICSAISIFKGRREVLPSAVQ